jgi:hypothetical protein
VSRQLQIQSEKEEERSEIGRRQTCLASSVTATEFSRPRKLP